MSCLRFGLSLKYTDVIKATNEIFFCSFPGKANWDNKAIYYAMVAQKFQNWRPMLYEDIKTDYNALRGYPAFPGI